MTTPTASPSSSRTPGRSAGCTRLRSRATVSGGEDIRALQTFEQVTTRGGRERCPDTPPARKERGSDRALGPQVGDLPVVIAQAAQHLLGVLAALRRGGADAAGDAGEVDRGGHELGLAEPGVLDRGGEAE